MLNLNSSLHIILNIGDEQIIDNKVFVFGLFLSWNESICKLTIGYQLVTGENVWQGNIRIKTIMIWYPSK